MVNGGDVTHMCNISSVWNTLGVFVCHASCAWRWEEILAGLDLTGESQKLVFRAQLQCAALRYWEFRKSGWKGPYDKLFLATVSTMRRSLFNCAVSAGQQHGKRNGSVKLIARMKRTAENEPF